MGALTSNRNKRDASSQSSPSSYDYDHHIAKKLKSSSHMAPIKASRSSVSRLSLYPQNVTPIMREIHAPCRFISGFAAKLNRLFTKIIKFNAQKYVFSGVMKNALFSKYNHAKEYAIGRCKHVKIKEEDAVVEVIDVDKEESVKDDMDDSGGSKLRGRKMLESDAMDVDVGVPLHKKLQQESDEKHDMSLRSLKFNIKLLEIKRTIQRQARRVKEKEDVANDPFRSLTEEEVEMIDNALSFSNRNKVLVTHENSNITITGEVLQCLKPGAWLNDEVINVYLELLKERETREPKKFLKCHFFNTFFYKKLISGKTGYDYKSVRRWTTQKKLGYSLIECDKIFVPIHKEVHWCLAVINKKEEKFQYLDSLGGVDKKVLRFLAKYITDEVKDKTGNNIDISSWEQEFVTDLPNQENGYDCGMFMIKYADFYSRDIGLCFNQEHMPYFRLRTAKEILKLRAN